MARSGSTPSRSRTSRRASCAISCENRIVTEALTGVSNVQLYLAIGVPLLFNAVLFGILFAHMNMRFESVDRRFDAVDRRFDAVDRRFDDMRDLWRAELRRVEEVFDARLKHLEDRR